MVENQIILKDQEMISLYTSENAYERIKTVGILNQMMPLCEFTTYSKEPKKYYYYLIGCTNEYEYEGEVRFRVRYIMEQDGVDFDNFNDAYEFYRKNVEKMKLKSLINER